MPNIPDGERPAHARVKSILDKTFEPTGLAARFPIEKREVDAAPPEPQSIFNKFAVVMANFLSLLGK